MSIWYLDWENGSNSVSNTPYGFYHMGFNSGGTYQIQVGDTITGASSGVTAKVQYVVLASGSWAGGDAAGTLYVCKASGSWTNGENFNVGANNDVATYANGTLAYAICAWRDITNGATAARIAEGDELRFAKSPDPVSMGAATFTDASDTISFTTGIAIIDNCEAFAASPGHNEWATAPATGVTVAGNTDYYKTSARAIAITMTGTYVWSIGGLLAYAHIPDTDFSSYTGISFWFRVSANLPASSIKIALMPNEDGTGIPIDSFVIDYALFATYFTPINYNFGRNINAGTVKSIAILSNTSTDINGGTTWTWYVDNIFAHTGLSLRSLVGANLSDDKAWYPIKSVSATGIVIGSNNQNGTTTTPYYKIGANLPTTVYRRETSLNTGYLPASLTTAMQTPQKTGTFANPITMTGGWNVETGVQDTGALTLIDGLQGGYGFYSVTWNINFWNLSKVGFVRNYQAFYVMSKTGFDEVHSISSDDIGFVLYEALPQYQLDVFPARNIYNIAPRGGYNSQAFTLFGNIPIRNLVSIHSCNYVQISGGMRLYSPIIPKFAARAVTGTCYLHNLQSRTVKGGGMIAIESAYYGEISVTNFNGTVGDDFTVISHGADNVRVLVEKDSLIKRSGNHSLRMSHNATGYRGDSFYAGRGLLVPVSSGVKYTIGVYIRKSHTSAGDSSSYGSLAPRLLFRANFQMEVLDDTVIATHPGGESPGDWVLVSGTYTPAANGVLELFVDCDSGTGGWINIDDWTVTY